MLNRNRSAIFLSLFFCSGATALVYEVVWSKFLAQMFGSTIYAQTVVLAAFMGGLALGNKLFGRWADGLKFPIRAYGYLEIAIGLYAFAFPFLDRIADQIFVRIGTGIVEQTLLLAVLKGALAVALLLGPTILMGGTLPLLAAWLQKCSGDAGRGSARFYSVNSLGAVTGAGLAGFWLVPTLGMIAALQLTALVNVIIGAIAMILGQHGPEARSTTASEKISSDANTISTAALRRAGMIVAVTGFVSMGLEVLAARSLALIFGSSLQSFAIVLMSFILGIGLGSAWIASPRNRGWAREWLVVGLLCGAALWVTLLVFNIERWVDVYRMLRTGLARTATGYLFNQLLAGGISLVVLGVPAASLGAVLPLMIRGMSQQGTLLGARVGALLTWNTLGAVGGTLVTGFVLMPLLGLRNAFGALALLLALVGLALAWQHRLRTAMTGAGVCALAAVALFVFGGEGWRHVMSSGVFRARETEFNARTLPLRKAHVSILLYEDAPDATVTVERGDGRVAPADLGLRINGKPDASTRGDLSTQLLLSHLPMLAQGGQAKDVFILGLGSGISAGALLAYPIEHIEVAENCEPVIRAGRLFAEHNRNVQDDPRVRIWREDARTVLKLRPQLYDVIITQPSNPWTAGVGSVFSKEYYELAASRLKPGGVVAQWFHVYEMSDDIVALVLRTFSSVYPHVEVWDTDGGDIVMIGSLQPWASSPEVYAPSFGIEAVRQDMARIGIRTPEMLLARQLASQRTGFAMGGLGAIQSDLFPVLEYAAPEAFYIGGRSHLLEKYDERTRQQILSPTAKREILANLPAADVRAVFGSYTTVNEELKSQFKPAAESVASIFSVTSSPIAQATSPSTEGWSAAITAALQAEDFSEARRRVLAAQQSHPGHPKLIYLSRVLERATDSQLATAKPALR